MNRAAPSERLLPRGMRVLSMSADGATLTILAEPEADSVRCPLCRCRSRRRHCRYRRTVADLPWRGVAVSVRVRARKTARLEDALRSIALELGREAGARLARELGLLVSPDALLSRAEHAVAAAAEKVRVLGVDDFAFRKGNDYGTILVDLECRRIVDLLPDCSQEGLVAWLERHPGVEVATRDRSKVFSARASRRVPLTPCRWPTAGTCYGASPSG